MIVAYHRGQQDECLTRGSEYENVVVYFCKILLKFNKPEHSVGVDSATNAIYKEIRGVISQII